ncbi:DUF2000 domain-containing protein [Gracilibacillus timonensis]|uniref:DUF2000 domain-containing protein n=1 Tax=Gracilibacillus timonensis TaxID=1816696 RepID=UPI000825F28C|nr:DUF2000 domain-containing protein [Gracilibacillus timonensis]
MKETKTVLVIDENLPLGLIANTAAILGVTLGMKAPEMIGEDVSDHSGVKHAGIVKTPVPILKGNAELLHQLRDRMLTKEFTNLTVVDFSNAAQSCKTYDEYIKKLQKMDKTDYLYYGLGIYGEKRKVNQLTGNLALLR